MFRLSLPAPVAIENARVRYEITYRAPRNGSQVSNTVMVAWLGVCVMEVKRGDDGTLLELVKVRGQPLGARVRRETHGTQHRSITADLRIPDKLVQVHDRA